MRRLAPIVLAAALVAAAVAAAVAKSREQETLPETPEGSWELDEHGTDA